MLRVVSAVSDHFVMMGVAISTPKPEGPVLLLSIGSSLQRVKALPALQCQPGPVDVSCSTCMLKVAAALSPDFSLVPDPATIQLNFLAGQIP